MSIHHSVQSVALDTLVDHRLGGDGSKVGRCIFACKFLKKGRGEGEGVRVAGRKAGQEEMGVTVRTVSPWGGQMPG